MARESIYDHSVRLQHDDEQKVVAELLDFAIQHRAVTEESAAITRRVMQRLVRAMLRRKRLTDDQRARMVERWGRYTE